MSTLFIISLVAVFLAVLAAIIIGWTIYQQKLALDAERRSREGPRTTMQKMPTSYPIPSKRARAEVHTSYVDPDSIMPATRPKNYDFKD